LVLLGLVVLAAEIYGLVRYDPAYFGAAYLDRYGTSEAVARTLEVALQTDDQALLTELQGLRWPTKFRTSPSIAFALLLEQGDRYVTYLYFDKQTYQRHPHALEEVGGRWVVSPPDLYYYIHSGQWQSIFLLLATIWWASSLAAMAVAWVLRISQRARTQLYGE
jgi:hypothetical protein